MLAQRSAQQVDNTCYQPRRNYAAMLLAMVTPGVVQVPQPGSLTLTGYAPTILQPSTGQAFRIVPNTQVDQTTIQPRRLSIAEHLAIVNNVGSNPVNVQIFTAGLQLQGFAPLVSQSTPVYSTQDYQNDWDEPELFTPKNPAWRTPLLSATGTQSVQAQLGTLTLAGFAPQINQSGSIFPPLAGLTLAGFAPSITQSGNTAINSPLGSLTLTGFAPIVSIVGGPIFADFGQLFLTGFPPTITQVAVPTYTAGTRFYIQRVTSRQFTVSASTGPRFEVMAPTEAVMLTFDFTVDLNPGETLIGGPAVSYAVSASLGPPDPNPQDIANGGPGYDMTSTKAIVPVSGGLDGNDYLITVTVPTSSTPQRTLTLVGILPIRVGTGV